MNNFWNTQSNFTLISIITFEVVNETSTNSQGNCRSTSRWCLQNYMENGWELTSELTSKWITFKNTQSNFTLISLITFEVINETPPNLQGSCRNTSRWCPVFHVILQAPSAGTTTIALWICRRFIDYFKSYYWD